MQAFGKLILTRPGVPEQEFTLAKARVSIGRAATNDIVLRDPKASRLHARLECGDASCTLVDLSSTNKTDLNGVTVDRALLKPGDVIAVGDSYLHFETTPPRPELELTPIHSEVDLEAALAQSPLPVSLRATLTPRLVVRTRNRTIEAPLTQETLTIGRRADNDIRLADPKVSRHHTRVERRTGGFVIRDLGSGNGTWFGGERIEERTLQDGDTIQIGDAQLFFKSGMETEAFTLSEPLKPDAKGARPPVVIVPGLMGSELWRGSERLWPNVRRFFADPEKLRLPDPEGQSPEARCLVGEVVIVPNLIKFEQYDRLGDFLEEALGYERGKDLMEFAYDWRQDVRLSAKRLAEAIENWEVQGPVTIIAHSLGCLVSRYYVEHLDGKDKVRRLILLGGPHLGVPMAMTRLLFGQEFLPLGLLDERMRQVLASFPSMYQILPTYPCAVDQTGRAIKVLEDETWLPERYRHLLRSAREFRRELRTRSSVPAVSIFGYGLKTVTGAKLVRDAEGELQKVNFTSESAGDSSVPQKSAVLAGSEIHPVQQYHGALYVDNDVKMRLKLELTVR